MLHIFPFVLLLNKPFSGVTGILTLLRQSRSTKEGIDNPERKERVESFPRIGPWDGEGVLGKP